MLPVHFIENLCFTMFQYHDNPPIEIMYHISCSGSIKTTGRHPKKKRNKIKNVGEKNSKPNSADKFIGKCALFHYTEHIKMMIA